MTAAVHFVVSDLHLGNDHFHHTQFLSWMAGLPVGASLILNGDIIDDPDNVLSEEHAAVLDRLITESHSRPVIWVLGNHDCDLDLQGTGNIRFEHEWEIGRRLLILHGHQLDEMMPRHGLFKLWFKLMHRALVFAGLPNVHVARFAKKWGFLYNVLNRHVAEKALRRAASSGHEAVTCGHTHAAIDVRQDGLRYLNTGAWTEEPLHYVAVEDEEIVLNVYGKHIP